MGSVENQKDKKKEAAAAAAIMVQTAASIEARLNPTDRRSARNSAPGRRRRHLAPSARLRLGWDGRARRGRCAAFARGPAAATPTTTTTNPIDAVRRGNRSFLLGQHFGEPPSRAHARHDGHGRSARIRWHGMRSFGSHGRLHRLEGLGRRRGNGPWGRYRCRCRCGRRAADLGLFGLRRDQLQVR